MINQGMINQGMINYLHDCNNCVSLGPLATKEDGEEIVYDLYICPTKPEDLTPPSLIARYGSNGPEYQSLCAFGSTLRLFKLHPSSPLAIAYDLAKAHGFKFVDETTED